VKRLALAALAACTSSGDHSVPAGDLQMNDLSVLLPLPTTQADLDHMLAPTAPAVGGELFPESIYDMGQQGIDYSSLRAVGFRLDPCFGQLGAIGDGTECKNQLRVVFQPVVVDTQDGETIAADAAIHAFYSITREQLLDAVDEIVAAREADHGDADLGPLAPNPVIASEGLGGTLAQAYLAIVTKYAGQANLVQFTSLQIEAVAGVDRIVGPGEFWQFEANTVANGTVTPQNIPTLPQTQSNMGLGAAPDPLQASFAPLSTSNDNINLIANFTMAQQATQAQRQASFDAALRVLNPHDNSPNTIDCATCHMAHPAVQLVGQQLGLTSRGDANAFVPDASIPVADLEQTTQFTDSEMVLNIHAFSYRETSPMINQRVINETAANLAYIASLR